MTNSDTLRQDWSCPPTLVFERLLSTPLIKPHPALDKLQDLFGGRLTP